MRDNLFAMIFEEVRNLSRWTMFILGPSQQRENYWLVFDVINVFLNKPVNKSICNYCLQFMDWLVWCLRRILRINNHYLHKTFDLCRKTCNNFFVEWLCIVISHRSLSTSEKTSSAGSSRLTFSMINIRYGAITSICSCDTEISVMKSCGTLRSVQILNSRH
jgi:hypothetical protein